MNIPTVFSLIIALSYGNECPQSHTHFVTTTERSLNPQRTPLKDLAGSTEEECRKACLEDSACKYASFDGKCHKSETGFATIEELDRVTQKAQKGRILQKICFDLEAKFCEDESGFEKKPQMILTGFMEQVISVTSEEACLQACVQTRNFTCQSIQFYHTATSSNCILNSQNRQSFPKFFTSEDEDLVDYIGVNCSSASTVRRAPKRGPDSRLLSRRQSCDDLSVRFMISEGLEIDNDLIEGERLNASSEAECLWMCKRNQVCRAASYNADTEECLLSAEINPSVNENPNSTMLSRVCLKSKAAKTCPGIIKRVPQFVLLGVAAELLGRAKMEDCLERCIMAETDFGYECRSLMFYPESPAPNCILNLNTAKEVGGTKGVFRPEYSRTVDYLELDCEAELEDGNEIGPAYFDEKPKQSSGQIVKDAPRPALCNPAQTRYAITDGHSMRLPIAGYKAENQTMCLRDCTYDQNCKAVLYDVTVNSCVTINAHVDREFLQPQVGSQYFEKICLEGVRADLTKCTSFFIKVPNHHLLGFEEAVIQTANFEACLKQCVDAVYLHGFVCKSGMFSEGECVLNTVDKNIQPELFFPSPVYPRDYFQFSCTSEDLEIGSLQNELETKARYTK